MKITWPDAFQNLRFLRWGLVGLVMSQNQQTLKHGRTTWSWDQAWQEEVGTQWEPQNDLRPKTKWPSLSKKQNTGEAWPFWTHWQSKYHDTWSFSTIKGMNAINAVIGNDLSHLFYMWFPLSRFNHSWPPTANHLADLPVFWWSHDANQNPLLSPGSRQWIIFSWTPLCRSGACPVETVKPDPGFF